MTTLFVSDLHLDAARPQITQLFLKFLNNEARHADALYILGDFFEAWIGDDDPDPHPAEVMAGVRALTDSGVPVYFMHGNRDFLIGSGFAHKTACSLLEDPTRVILHGTPTLLMHGDTLCTDDLEYQKFRRQMHAPAWQSAFLAKPLAARREFAQQARAGNPGWMKLPEFHVLQWQSGSQHHAEAVSGIDHGIAAVAEHTPCPAGCEQRRTRLDQQRLAGLDRNGGDTEAIAVGVAQQIECEILVEELRAMLDILLVKRVQQRMAGAVGSGTRPRGLLAAEVLRLAAEGTLVDGAVVEARERQPHVLEFVYCAGGLTAHELDRILIPQPVAALDRVVHVPFPAVVVDVGKRGGDAALRRHGVRARRENLGHHRDLVVGARELQRCAQSGAAAADDERIEAPRVHDRPQSTAASHVTLPARMAITARYKARRSPVGWT